jgi:hypothetical protein
LTANFAESAFVNRPPTNRFNSSDDLRMLLTFCSTFTLDIYRPATQATLSTGPTMTTYAMTSPMVSSPFKSMILPEDPFDKFKDLSSFSACDLDKIVYVPNKYNFMHLLRMDECSFPLCFKMLHLMTQKNRVAIDLFLHLSKNYSTDGMILLHILLLLLVT